MHTKRVWVFYTQINRSPRHRVALSNTVVFFGFLRIMGHQEIFHRTVTPAGWPRRPNGHGFRPRLLRSHLPNARRSPRWTTVPLTRLRRLQLTPSPPKRLHIRRGDGARLWRQLTPSPPKRLHAALSATVNCRQRQCLGQTAVPCCPCGGHDLLGKTGRRHCRGTCQEAARAGKML